MHSRTFWYWNFCNYFQLLYWFFCYFYNWLHNWKGTGVLIFNHKPALPWPNLGLIGGISLKSTIGFTTCFSDNIFRSSPLPMPHSSGNQMPLDFTCDLV